jgi:multidrug resistance efflux pump
MPPEDRQKLRNDQRKIERTLERNEAALRTARRKSQSYSQTLRNSGAQVQSARSDLRRAGFLKK